jgi:Domain of unknown function (DUF4142)
MKVLSHSLSLLIVLSVATFGEAIGAASLSSADVSFVQNAQRDALGQYAIGSLGTGRAQDHRVKVLAKTVTENATSAIATLKKVAGAHGVALKSKPTVRASYQYSNLSEASGASFDRAFLNRIGIDATIAADTYAEYAAHGSNAQLRHFAKEEATTLKSIAAQAQRLHNASS